MYYKRSDPADAQLTPHEPAGLGLAALGAIMRRMFPAAGAARLEHAWCGVLGVPRDWCASVGLDPATGLGWAGGYTGHGVAAAGVNYGGCPKDTVQALAGPCPIVGSYAGKDRSPMGRSAAPRLAQALQALGVDHDVKVYPGAGHGFLNNPDPAAATPWLIFLAKISGTRYHEPSARDARRRIAAFFARHLRPDAS